MNFCVIEAQQFALLVVSGVLWVGHVRFSRCTAISLVPPLLAGQHADGDVTHTGGVVGLKKEHMKSFLYSSSGLGSRMCGGNYV